MGAERKAPAAANSSAPISTGAQRRALGRNKVDALPRRSRPPRERRASRGGSGLRAVTAPSARYLRAAPKGARLRLGLADELKRERDGECGWDGWPTWSGGFTPSRLLSGERRQMRVEEGPYLGVSLMTSTAMRMASSFPSFLCQ